MILDLFPFSNSQLPLGSTAFWQTKKKKKIPLFNILIKKIWASNYGANFLILVKHP